MSHPDPTYDPRDEIAEYDEPETADAVIEELNEFAESLDEIPF